MGMLKEFKEFALKGNMMDMAIGIVIGGAFGTVIKSLVDDIIMPPIGYVLSGIDFSSLSLKLATDGDPVEIKYGSFINAMISLLIIAAALFMVVKVMNKARAQFESGEEKPPTTKTCPQCRMDIPVDATKCGHCTSPV